MAFLKTGIEKGYGVHILGIECFGQKGLEYLIPSVLHCAESKRYREIEKKGSSKAGIGNSGADDHLNPGQ